MFNFKSSFSAVILLQPYTYIIKRQNISPSYTVFSSNQLYIAAVLFLLCQHHLIRSCSSKQKPHVFISCLFTGKSCGNPSTCLKRKFGSESQNKSDCTLHLKCDGFDKLGQTNQTKTNQKNVHVLLSQIWACSNLKAAEVFHRDIAVFVLGKKNKSLELQFRCIT